MDWCDECGENLVERDKQVCDECIEESEADAIWEAGEGGWTPGER